LELSHIFQEVIYNWTLIRCYSLSSLAQTSTKAFML